MNTIDYYDYQKELKRVNEELREISNRLMNEDHWKGYAEITAVSYGDQPIKTAVNWCAIGDTEPDKAIAFAELLKEAAELAKGFKYNGYTPTFN